MKYTYTHKFLIIQHIQHQMCNNTSLDKNRGSNTSIIVKGLYSTDTLLRIIPLYTIPKLQPYEGQ